MPSPIPNPLYGAVNNPTGTSQVACVHCLRDGVHAPQEIIYYYGGYSLCMSHVQQALTPAQNVSHVS
jgi:hypothetical protein